MIVVQHVSKQYGDYTALTDINLEFANGIYGLLAPNGAGKTTLIKMMVTLIAPSQGEILCDGKNIFDMGEAYRERLGYLPQQFGFYKNYTPKQYLSYLAALKGIAKKEAAQLIPELLDKVALSEAGDKKMKKFSGGMIQRVGIAQALLNDPQILILDEPTAGLDPKERARFRHLLTELARNRLVIVSTHIVSDIESIANEIIMIKNRRILYKDTVNSICGSLDGHVYEASIRYEQLDSFRSHYVILSEKQDRDMMNVRFIHLGGAEDSWHPVAPHLEDVFLYEYRDEIQAEG